MMAARDWLDMALRRPAPTAMALGGIAACGFRPLALWPLTILAVAGLMILCARAVSGKRAFLIGWAFGLGHFTIGNNWIATAFTYQANMPAWLGWVAVVLLSLYLAVYPGLATLAAWWLARRMRRDASRHLPAFGGLLAASWIVTEWLRSWIFTGFAWNPLGVALLGDYNAQGLALLAPIMGTYALSGLVVLLAALVCAAGARFSGGRDGRSPLMLAAAFTIAVMVSAVMLLPSPWLARDPGGLSFTLIQPDVRQEVLDDPTQWESQFQRTARLSTARRPDQHRLVLWPESGIPDYLREGYPAGLYRATTFAADPGRARERIGQAIGRGSLLLTGAVDIVVEDGDDVAARNVVTALDGKGSIVAGYAKAHLVPYGEYLALRWLLEPLGASRLVAGALDFWPGPGAQTLDLGTYGRAGIQICYEIIFSGQVVERGHRPDYIFNPSNDGWFGAWGPPQHLAQARLRAIEEGLPVLRSTTTGISAVVDADGIVRRYIPRHTAGRIDGRIPYAHPPTLFSRLGNALSLGWGALILLVSLVALRRRAS